MYIYIYRFKTAEAKFNVCGSFAENCCGDCYVPLAT